MRFLKPGWLIVYLIIGVYVWNRIAGTITLSEPVFIQEWQTAIVAISKEVSRREAQRLKRAWRGNDELRMIQPGQYVFSGQYSIGEITDVFLEWPKSNNARLTILEWRNKRDVDALLVTKGLIDAGEYLAFVTNQEIIAKYATRYPFLAQAIEERGSIATLEWFLYPDTYIIDSSKDTIDQLVYLQLEAFNDRIWKVYGDQLTSLTQWLQNKWYSFPLSMYGGLILASVIEKEENKDANKPLIASIFFNRLQEWMRLDADITLCYGFSEPYETCTPSRIAQHLDDKGNEYNTRAVTWLPPTPISTIHVKSVQALFEAPKTDYLFYLHNKNGEIFPAKTNSEHNLNKSKEL